jgi:hypothetical protein
MAIIQNPLIGRGSGKIGNVVFTQMYGLNILKSKPLQVKRNDTKIRLEWRQKMRISSYIVRQGKNALRSYAPTSLSECPFTSYFNGQFLKNVSYDLNADHYTIDYNNFLGGGKPFFAREGVNNVEIPDSDTMFITLNDTSTSEYQMNNNQYYVVALDSNMKVLYVGSEMTYDENNNTLSFISYDVDMNNISILLITIQNTPNLSNVYPSDVLLPTTKDECNSFYLTVYIPVP